MTTLDAFFTWSHQLSSSSASAETETVTAIKLKSHGRICLPPARFLVAGAHRPRQGQHADPFGAGAAQSPRAFLDGGAGGQHVVDDDDPLALDAAAVPHRKGAAHVPGPRRRPEPALRRRAPPADQPIR